jgi:hypothetical protein
MEFSNVQKALRTFLVSTIVYVALAGTWAIASPLSSIPDEPAHMIRAAAVVRAQIVTEAWAAFPAYAGVIVPEYVANTHQLTCFAFQPAVTPDCAPVGAVDVALVSPTLIGTSAALNSPLYYFVVGWPTLFLSGEPALFAMRFVNVAVFGALMGLAFSQLRRMLLSTRWSTVALIAASTPMLLFLGGSVNPNAIEAAGTLAFYLLTLSSLRRPPHGAWRWASPTVIAAVALLVVNTRSIGFLWIALAILVVVTQTGWGNFLVTLRTRWLQTVLVLGGSAVIGSLVWFTMLPDYDQSIIPTNPATPLSAFLRATLGVFEYGDGLIGSFGWLDTPAPVFSAIAFSAVGLGLIFFSSVLTAGLDRWAPLFFTSLIVVVPAVVQTVIAKELGYIWQGRYLLAMYLCAVVAAGIALDRYQSAPRRGEVDHWASAVPALILILAAAQLAAFVQVLRRYVVGADAPYSQMLTNPDWQPPGSWLGLSMIFAISIAAAGWGAVRGSYYRGEAIHKPTTDKEG